MPSSELLLGRRSPVYVCCSLFAHSVSFPLTDISRSGRVARSICYPFHSKTMSIKTNRKTAPHVIFLASTIIVAFWIVDFLVAATGFPFGVLQMSYTYFQITLTFWCLNVTQNAGDEAYLLSKQCFCTHCYSETQQKLIIGVTIESGPLSLSHPPPLFPTLSFHFDAKLAPNRKCARENK